jgi:hypothetical protein
VEGNVMGWNRMGRHVAYMEELRNVLQFSFEKYKGNNNPEYLHARHIGRIILKIFLKK